MMLRSLRSLRVPGCTLLLLALACGKSGTCPDAKVSDCCCFEFDDNTDFGDRLVVLCDQPATCEELLADCPVDGSPCTLKNPDALGCLFQTLQSDTPGKVSWQTNPIEHKPDEYSPDQRIVTLYTAGNGSVFRSATRNTGFTFNNEAVTRHTLASIDIDGCAALADAPARFDCLRAAFTAPAETCIDPFKD